VAPSLRVKPTTITVTVKTMTGKNHMISLAATAGVIDLMKKIEAIDGMPVSEQRLLYCGLQLESHRTLASYGVVDKSIIQAVRRQVGGGGGLESC
jgi:hypothetical protein